jgi:hypothetical protein
VLDFEVGKVEKGEGAHLDAFELAAGEREGRGRPIDPDRRRV